MRDSFGLNGKTPVGGQKILKSSTYLQRLLKNGWDEINEDYVKQRYIQSKWIGGVIVINNSQTDILVVSKDGDKKIVGPFYSTNSDLIEILKPISTLSGAFWKEIRDLGYNRAEPIYRPDLIWLRKVIPMSSIRFGISRNNYYTCDSMGDPSIIITNKTTEEDYENIEYPKNLPDLNMIIENGGLQLNELFKNKLPSMIINDPTNKLKNEEVFLELGTLILTPLITNNVHIEESITILGPDNNGIINTLFRTTKTDIIGKLYNYKNKAVSIKSDIDSDVKDIHMSRSVVILEQVIADRQHKLDEYERITAIEEKLIMEAEKLKDDNQKAKIELRTLRDKLSEESIEERKQQLIDAREKRAYDETIRMHTKKGEKIKFFTNLFTATKTVVITVLSLVTAVIMWKIKHQAS